MSATNPAFFMGRAELLGWINDTLGTRLTKIEDTSNGAIACQLMDALHGGVPMKKLDFNARSEYDMINNYKVLQEVFQKHNVDKYIEVSKLIKGKPLDNIEFLQWFKMYFDNCTNGQAITDYDGPSRRGQSKTGDLKGQSGPAPAAGKLARVGGDQGKVVPVAHQGSATRTGGARPSPGLTPGRDVEVGGLAAQVKEWRERCEALEKEKDFYYSKLREIEMLCQTPVINEVPVMKSVEAILYAATAEEGRTAMLAAQREFANMTFEGEPTDAPPA